MRPGDSPETMPLDNHLFADVNEGVSRNVAFTFDLDDDDPHKYSLATPRKAYQSIQRTIKAGCPCESRILEDILRIPRTLKRIIDAQGAYVDDSDGTRHGVRDTTRRELRRNTVDSAVMASFLQRVQQMKEGKGVLFKHSIQMTEVESIPVLEDRDGHIGTTSTDG